MDVHERLSLEAVNANTLIGCEHHHRYTWAAQLIAGMKVLDLGCGTGYGCALLAGLAKAVTGVDNDAATIDMARATVGVEHDIEFRTADAVEYLQSDHVRSADVIVCFETLEHLDRLDLALERLADLAQSGMKLIISVPNSRFFEEQNEFHLKDFDYASAVEAFSSIGEFELVAQHHAEGSLLHTGAEATPRSEVTLRDRGEIEAANHFLATFNFPEPVVTESARMQLAVAPLHNRYLRDLESANVELWRVNARFARSLMQVPPSAGGPFDAAAASHLRRKDDEIRKVIAETQQRIRETEASAEDAYRRIARAERTIAELEGSLSWRLTRPLRTWKSRLTQLGRRR